METKDYLPKDVKFDIPEQLGFPTVIFGECINVDELRKLVSEYFIALQEKDTVGIRFLDDMEKEWIRDEYQVLLESKKPRLDGELDAIIAESKSKIKEAKAKYQAVVAEIDDLVRQVRIGTKRMELKFGETFRIPVGENYLYYSWINEKFKLCHVRTIPQWERSDVFNSSSKNAETFKDLYGVKVKELQPLGAEYLEDLEPEE
jgi:hypothetical protein